MSIIIARQLVPADFIWFDAFDQFRNTQAKTATKHPVIPTPEITDHIQLGPVSFSFRGLIGTPALVPSATAIRARLFFDTLGTGLAIITTPYGVFANMVASFDVEERGAGALVVTVRAEQVRIPSITEIPIPPRTPAPQVAAQASSAADAGTAGAGAGAASAGAAAATGETSLSAQVLDAGAATLDLLGF